MDEKAFYKSFYFSSYRFSRKHSSHVDGVEGNYIVVMNKGKGRILSNGKEIILNEGEFLFIPDRCRYESFWKGEPQCEFETFVFKIYPEADVKPVLQKLTPTKEMLELYSRIKGVKQVNSFSVGIVYQLFGLMLPMLKRRSESKHERIVNEAIGIISTSDDISIPEIAERLKISESTLYSVFNEVTGTTPIKTYHRIKAEEAVNLLTTTDMTVQAISEHLGFNSVQYFRKVIYKETEKTPKEIRNGAESI
jgi:AraC-like DNA-binding protein